MDTLKLNNGNKIPVIGLGTWKSDKKLVTKAVHHALTEAGYKHIDCALIYENEQEVGEGLTKAFSEGISRKDVFITSKLWNTHHNPRNVELACKKSLADLHLEYLDLYLMHWSLAFPQDTYKSKLDSRGLAIRENIPVIDTWQAMEKLVEKGLVRSIGVANFQPSMLVDLLAYAKVKPVVSQIELHPYNTQEDFVEFCKKEGIVVTAYSPLGTPGTADPHVPVLIKDSVITKIAKKYKKTNAQILIRWALQRGTVIIPKSTDPERIKENISIFDFSLEIDDMAEISKLNRNLRYVDPISWWGIPYFN